MELLQLKYFQRAAQLESITKAAEEFCISQPSLSKTIKTLETELGVSLFDRVGKYIKLNAAGRVFLEQVSVALNALDSGKRKLAYQKERESVQISVVFLAASPFMPDLFCEFKKIHPQADFNLLQHIAKTPLYHFDACISTLPLAMDGIESVPVIHEEIFLAVPNTHRLAHRKSIRLIEAEKEGFVSLKPVHTLRGITDEFCRKAGFSPHIVFESDDPSTVRGLIKAGQGVGFIPAITWAGAVGSSVKLLRITDPSCFRTIGISHSKTRVSSALAVAFRDFAYAFLQSKQDAYQKTNVQP
ncbi:MAG: hypothetical protein BGN88_10315 [Clostridiales bacterium 43-6]|nr:MAG: hypothetical protein BGN88_10315 [Clostridiales bacterium 43-6]